VTAVAGAASSSSSATKTVWIETTNVQVLLASLESGLTTTALFAGPNAALADDWRNVGRFDVVRLDLPSGVLFSAETPEESSEADVAWNAVGVSCAVSSPEDVQDVARLAGVEPLVVVDCQSKSANRKKGTDQDSENLNWRIIPAENLVAAYGSKPESSLFFFADSFLDARAVLEALHVGVDGVVLRTEDPNEARALARYVSENAFGARVTNEKTIPSVEERVSETSSSSDDQKGDRRRTDIDRRIDFARAAVTRVEIVGLGDRVCVDCTSAFSPGEGLLVGSFARGLFLAHSECVSSFGYVNTRPFRVNAGPLCSYVLLPGGKTGYLSELKAGDEVLCVASDGTKSTKTVGRVKIEKRQMVLVEATLVDGECDLDDEEGDDDSDDGGDDGDDFLCVDTSDGTMRATTYSVLLQNAETVRLVGDAATGDSVSVSAMRVGDGVLVHRMAGGRHTGIEIAEEGWEER
jgi:3-dehydroquinate synthase class II